MYISNRLFNVGWRFSGTKACIISIGSLLVPMFAQAQDPIIIPLITDKIKLDGVLDEEVWQRAKPTPVVAQRPVFGAPPSEKTEIYLVHDADYLYLAGRHFTKDPESIIATSKERDAFTLSNDWFGIIIDTYNDKENAVAFFTTPEGLRLDLTVSNDAERVTREQIPLNPFWDTFWDVKSVRSEEGWFSEMRIPFGSLRFQEKDGKAKMGMITWRYIAHNNELDVFPAIPLNWGQFSAWKPSQAQEYIIEGIRSKRPLFVTPYVLTGFQRNTELNEPETGYDNNDELVSEAGIDIKYGLSNNLNLDLTVNTDFAQVEADVQQVNLTRFSLFFPERRRFFLERGAIFDFPLGGPNRLFYSRRIGLYEGDIVRIYGGARLVGRSGPWDFGFLNMQTEAVDSLDENPAQPSTNWGVFRMRRRVLNSNSYIGAMVTNKVHSQDRNTAYGVDGIFRLFGQDFLRMSWAQTFTDSIQSDGFDNWRYRVNWEKRNFRGFGYNLSVSGAGRDYNPEMGFELREDYTRFGNEIWYGWIPEGNGKLLNHRLLWESEIFLNNPDGRSQSSRIGPSYVLSLKNGFSGRFGFRRFVENVDEDFDFSENDDAFIPAGFYEYYGGAFRFETANNKPIWARGRFRGGQFYDGHNASLTVTPTWNVSSSLEIAVGYEYNYVNLPKRDQKFIAHLASLRTLVMFDLIWSLSLFVQYHSADEIMIGNARLRFNPKEGHDLFVVYNEGRNSDRFRESPPLPGTDQRAILLKYQYTFNW